MDECTICRELLDSNSTHRLSCKHAYCQHCLRDLTMQAQKKGTTSLQCPTCQSQTATPLTAQDQPLTSIGMSSVAKPVALIKHACVQCQQYDKNEEAIQKCVSCDEDFCDPCKERHLKIPVFANHKFKLIVSELCLKHGKPLDIVCKACNVVICNICTMDRVHESHPGSLVDFTEAMEELSRDVQLQQHSLEGELQALKGQMCQVDQRIHLIQELRRKIVDAAEEVQGEIDMQLQKLTVQLDKDYRFSTKNVLVAQKKQQERLQTCGRPFSTMSRWSSPNSMAALLLILHLSCSEVVFHPLSVTYIPCSYNPQPVYKLFGEASEQIAHDRTAHITYTIGGSGYMHAIDMQDPSKTSILYHQLIRGVPNDIDACGGYVAITVRNESVPLPGKVEIYRAYDRNSGTMDLINTIPVGHAPASMITFTRNCQRILVANEGEAGKDEKGRFADPEGSVTVITFTSVDLSQEPLVKTADFTKFNERAKEYTDKGVRWVYKGQRSGKKSNFSTDLEPEYIALSPDEKTAYVVLQENNAIAVMDVESAEMLEIYPLGFKDWQQYGGLDASDRDGGINIKSWPVYGMYQPDALKQFTLDGVSYLVTANEGDKKDYTMEEHGVTWTEISRGKIFTKANLLSESIDEEFEDALRTSSELGRLRLSLVDGREGMKYKYERFYAYGGRSFSIWRADNISLVYDSGSDIERKHAELMPDVFNSHVARLEHVPRQDKDDRSDDHGPEVEVVEPAVVGDKVYIFVGNQRVSTIMVYSVEGTGINPRFEALYRAGGRNRTWQKLFEDHDIGDSDLQDIKYIPPEESPNKKPFLLVSGSLGGTLAAYEIEFK